MIYLVTVSAPSGTTTFTAKRLEIDGNIDGNFIATGITGFCVTLKESTFLPNVYSFRRSDLISYMAGQWLEEGPLDLIGFTSSSPAAAPSPAPAPHQEISQPQGKV